MKVYQEFIFIFLSVLLYVSGLYIHYEYGYLWIGLILEISGIPAGLLALGSAVRSAVQQGEP